MKKLLLLLLLSFLSTQSLAKVGDVYYCEMFNHFEIATRTGFDGKIIKNKAVEWDLVPFSFLRQDKQIKFSDSFRWADSMPVKFTKVVDEPSIITEQFQGYNDFTHQHMVGGVTNFVYTQTKKGGEFSFILQGSLGVFVILAECEIL